MKYFLLLLSLAISLSASNVTAGQLEVDIHGMTCAFCVDSVQRNLGKLPDVKSVEVSLKLKKVRIQTKGEKVNIERIRETILDAGFTPVKISSLPDAQ